LIQLIAHREYHVLN